MLYALIVACEVLFRVFLLAGLATRYLLRKPRLGAALLICAPLVDLILLVAVTVDLRAGADPSLAHLLAAIYLGISVGFGHSMVRWADVRFAHRYADGPAPEPTPRHGAARAAHERRQLARHVVAWAVGAGIMIAAGWYVGTAEARDYFFGAARLWTIILAIDAVWSLSYTIWRTPARSSAD